MNRAEFEEYVDRMRRSGAEADDRQASIDARVGARLKGQKVLVRYHALDGRGMPVDNLDAVAVEGRVRFTGSQAWRGGASNAKTWRSRVVVNPTWLTLCALANGMLAAIGGGPYLRDVKVVATEKGVKTARFVIGR